jgi:xanthine dehydrogenase YagR molybdenum-binding subunit
LSEVTGEVRISRWLGAFDTDRIINPKTAKPIPRRNSHGTGAALTEDALFDERYGRIINPSMAEYHVPVHADVPEIDIIWPDEPDPLAPMGPRASVRSESPASLRRWRMRCSTRSAS